MSMKIISVADIEGFKLGNAENSEKGTGCTVIVCEEGAVGGVDVRGGGPATRETDLLRSENTVNSVNAVVLSGGSAFGLEAASGVMRELADRGVGFHMGKDITIPIVCGASLYDLEVGDPTAFPDVNMGMVAVRNAYDGLFMHGNHGAGTGATVGKFVGHDRAMKTGLGTFACGDGFVEVGAVVAVNALGDIYNGAGNIIAGLRSEDGASIYGTIKTLKGMVHDNTVTVDDATSFINRSDIEEALAAIEARDETEEKTDLLDQLESEPSYDPEPAEPAETFEPDTLPEEEQAEEPAEEPLDAAYTDEISVPEAAIQEETEAAEESDETFEAAETEPAEEPAEEAHRELTPEEMGYDIAFNTTISCLITNADLTKSHANKLASILHNAYATAIKPVHGTLDGDTVFVLASGKQKVNFDAFAALATDVMQYAIIDGATSAKGAYGLPAARDIKKPETE